MRKEAWYIYGYSVDCRYRCKENNKILCKHNEQPILYCSENLCPLKVE